MLYNRQMKRFVRLAVPILSLLIAGCIPRLSGPVQTSSVPPPQQTAPPAPVVSAPQAMPPQAPTPAQPSRWAAQPVAANAVSVVGSSYIVQQGDTLRGIGNRTGAGSEAIALANALTYPYVLRAGQRLMIPAGRYHEVMSGQTGIAIANAYGVRWGDLITENALVEPYVLRVGQRLRLPANARVASAPPRPATLEDRAAAFDPGIGDLAGGGARPPVTTPQPPVSRPVAGGQVGRLAGNLAWPIDGRIIARFGRQGAGKVNDGIDIAAPLGTPIRAAADGTVVYSGNEIRLFGGLMLIDHGEGLVTAYANAGRLDVAEGARVRRGQIIGASGDSGSSASQPQLHFEVRRNRRPVDPLGYLPAR